MDPRCPKLSLPSPSTPSYHPISLSLSLQGKTVELEYEPAVRTILAGELEVDYKGEKLSLAKVAPDLSCAGVRIYKDIAYEKRLGEGGCAVIYLAQQNGVQMAMKELKRKPNAEFQKFRGTPPLSIAFYDSISFNRHYFTGIWLLTWIMLVCWDRIRSRSFHHEVRFSSLSCLSTDLLTLFSTAP